MCNENSKKITVAPIINYYQYYTNNYLKLN